MWLHKRVAPLLLGLLAMTGALPLGREEAWAAPGQPCALPPVALDVASGAQGSYPALPVDVEGTLFFTADDGIHGTELWRSDGTAVGTALVEDLRSGLPSSTPRELTAMGGVLFFIISDPGLGTELWRSDGTAAGTALVKLFPPPVLASDAELTAVGDTLFFVASDGVDGVELWKSDGTSAGTVLVKNIASGAGDSFPGALTAVGELLFFRADDGSSGLELWKSDGTEAGTVRVKDIAPGPGTSFPNGLTAVGSTLFFTANDGTSNANLWKSDGTEAGTSVVRDLFAGPFHPSPQELTAVGDMLFFWINDEVHGEELWKSDGTEAGTVLVRDIQPGPAGAFPGRLTAVGDTLFFVANDGVSGQELWRSDGTEAGTRRVRDLLPGPGNPFFSQLAPGPGVLLMVVDDGVSGLELWKSDGTAEGTFLLADIAPGPAASSPRALAMSGSTVFFVAEHPSQGEELFALPFTGIDCTRPSPTCPANLALEAISGDGASVTYPPVDASDDSVYGLTVQYSPESGTLPLGETMVVATVRDVAGNFEQCPFVVSVRDTTPPWLLCPEALVQEATSPAGAVASYFVVASDAVSDSVSVDYSLPPGSQVGVGPPRTVTATARDDAGNEGSCQFSLTVEDTTAPRLTCPEDVVRVVSSAEERVVDYTVTAEDAVSTPEVSASHASGSTFPIGVTPVTVTARDAAGKESACGFRVILLDSEGPTVTCPGPQRAQASGDAGEEVDFPEAIAEDNAGSPTVSYSHAPGSTFPVGETVVTATATDVAGRTASCTFTITVEARPGGVGEGCQAGPSGGGGGWLWLLVVGLLVGVRSKGGRGAPAIGHALTPE